jgi:UDP-N-acetylglucosamine 2-epimerase
MLRQVDAVIGNSSSGIHEVPSFGKPTVNIGIRQAGRLKADSVIDCEAHARDILAALSKALSPEFRERASKTTSPYGGGNASAEIKEILKSVDLEGIVVKTFHDLDFDCEPSAHQGPAKRKG